MTHIEIVTGDITDQAVDAIVNAANQTLLGGSGVDGAIHRVAGPELLAECKTLGGCPMGEARITRGYNLPAKHVIHTVGPIWQGGRQHEAQRLMSCYDNSIELAEQHGLETIAFPSISTGAFTYPIHLAARIAVRTVRHRLAKPTSLQLVRFVCYHEDDAGIYRGVVDETEGT